MRNPTTAEMNVLFRVAHGCNRSTGEIWERYQAVQEANLEEDLLDVVDDLETILELEATK